MVTLTDEFQSANHTVSRHSQVKKNIYIYIYIAFCHTHSKDHKLEPREVEYPGNTDVLRCRHYVFSKSLLDTLKLIKVIQIECGVRERNVCSEALVLELLCELLNI
jgi:hypothetical protein